MSTFTYLCLNAAGAEARGTLEAPDEGMARRRLREQGFRILSIAEGLSRGAGWRNGIRLGLSALPAIRPLGDSDRTLFFRQMSLMLQTGHTLLESLSVCGKLSAKGRIARITGSVSDRIRRGSSLSAAVSTEKELFNKLSVKLIEAGEASGELGAVFERLAIMVERRMEVRRQLVTALIYPAFLLLVAVGVVVFLVTKVMPRFTTFLAGHGKALPWAAQSLMDIADGLSRWGWIIGAVSLGMVVGMVLARHFASSRLLMDRLSLSVPVLGGLLSSAALAQSTWIFSVLVKSRLTVLETLRICAQAASNSAYAQAFSTAEQGVLMGKSLSMALSSPALPLLVRHMAAVGEKSGQIETVMEALGAFYQKSLEARTKMLAAMIVPAMTLLVGGVVGFVYYAFFQAMLSVSRGG